MIGWNGHHTAVTLPDGTSVSSGEGGGVKIGGLGAYQPQFTHHMYLPMSPDGADMVESAIEDEAPPVENPVEPPVDNDAPAPIEEPVVADVAPVPAVGEPAPAVDAPVMA